MCLTEVQAETLKEDYEKNLQHVSRGHQMMLSKSSLTTYINKHMIREVTVLKTDVLVKWNHEWALSVQDNTCNFRATLSCQYLYQQIALVPDNSYVNSLFIVIINPQKNFSRWNKEYFILKLLPTSFVVNIKRTLPISKTYTFHFIRNTDRRRKTFPSSGCHVFG